MRRRSSAAVWVVWVVVVVLLLKVKGHEFYHQQQASKKGKEDSLGVDPTSEDVEQRKKRTVELVAFGISHMDEFELSDHRKQLLKDIAGMESSLDEKLLPLQGVYREDGLRVRLTGVIQYDLVKYAAAYSGREARAGSQQACKAVIHLMVAFHRLKHPTPGSQNEDIITVDVAQLFQTYSAEVKTLKGLDFYTTHDAWAIRMLDAYFEKDEMAKKAKEEWIGKMAFEIFPKKKEGGKKKSNNA